MHNLTSAPTAAVITRSQADLIAANLREAGMDTRVGGGEGPGPIFRWTTGTQVMAAIVALVAQGGLPLPFLVGQDWQTVSFEEIYVDGHWSSLELTWAPTGPLVYCEAHNPRGTAPVAHRETATCVHPHLVGP